MKRGGSVKKSIFQQASFLLCLLLSLLGPAKPTSTLDSELCTVGGSLVTTLEKTSRMEVTLEDEKDDILVVFSDLDGTLIHYPDKSPGTKGLLKLPPSATGMRGIISSKTLAQIQEIRAKGIKFVLVSGMRTSTFLSRVPYLPRADAYCTEAGGRIFYPTSEDHTKKVFKVTPKKYDGATEEDLKTFGLVEDLEWRAHMEKTAGPFGSASLNDIAADPTKVPDINQRDGLLWDFARDLTSKGYVLDTKGYSACFRVNLKQQTIISATEFAALSDGTVSPFRGLATSVNLACVDYYPKESGKKNCCQYLAAKFYPEHSESKVLADHAVCLCDDDNDLEMAVACRHAYIPDVSSKSMAEIIKARPKHFTQTGGEGADLEGPSASEAALSMLLSLIAEKNKK